MSRTWRCLRWTALVVLTVFRALVIGQLQWPTLIHTMAFQFKVSRGRRGLNIEPSFKDDIGNLSTSMYHCCFVAMRFSVYQSSYKFATRLKATSLYSLFSFFLYRHRRELLTYITGLLIAVLFRSLLWFSVDSTENKERKVPFLSHVQSLPRMVLFCVVACI